MADIKRFIRYCHNNHIHYGRLEHQTIYELSGNFLNPHTETGVTCALSEVQLLAPVEPRTILCVGRNYKSHAGDKAAEIPGIFAKFPTTIIGPNAPIPYARGATDLHYEGEMVVVIGKTCSALTADQVADHVFGVTCGNDMSERNWQKADLQWIRAKASDGFGPLGPCIVTDLNYNDLLLETRVNGETVQSERTSMLIHNVATVISFISQTITLHPGDIVYTGTPGQTKAVKPGDILEVELENVGILRNEVVALK